MTILFDKWYVVISEWSMLHQKKKSLNDQHFNSGFAMAYWIWGGSVVVAIIKDAAEGWDAADIVRINFGYFYRVSSIHTWSVIYFTGVVNTGMEDVPFFG